MKATTVIYKGQLCPVLETQRVYGNNHLLIVFSVVTPTLASKPITQHKKIWVSAEQIKPYRAKKEPNKSIKLGDLVNWASKNKSGIVTDTIEDRWEVKFPDGTKRLLKSEQLTINLTD
jgi:hypothetical protein